MLKWVSTARLIINLWHADILLNYFYICSPLMRLTHAYFDICLSKKKSEECQKPERN